MHNVGLEIITGIMNNDSFVKLVHNVLQLISWTDQAAIYYVLTYSVLDKRIEL